jgi:Zn-dependent peptidase ImmA (M78 family)/DNA-binding XRE family transcriptional regulator
MDINILDTLDLHALGKELQQARMKRGMSQEEAAKIINVARTTITAIEKGERRIKADELIKLAQAYGREVSDFVRSRPRVEPLPVQFRGPVQHSREEGEKIVPFIDALEELSTNYLELEKIESSPLVRKYPPPYQTTGLQPEQAAEDVAVAERNRLGLGDGPLPILRDILEEDVGLRIFYLPLQPSKFSAIYLYDDKLGGCIAVNSQHPEERRRWSLAHEYGHFLAHRYQPGVFIENVYQRVPESERFADSFALYFLMPSNGLKRRFNDIRRTKEKITPADLCTLAHYYGVSVAAMTLRLEDMRLVPTGIWDQLQRRGFKILEAQRQLGLGVIPARNEKLPMRYQYLAVDAFDKGLLTEGQFARFLGVDRVEARSIAEILRQQTRDITDDSLINLDMTQSLGA